VLWKEWREAAGRARGVGWAPVVTAAAAITAWGWLARCDLRAAAVVCALPALVAVSWAGDSFVGERERRTLGSLLATPLHPVAVFLGKVLASAALSWGIGAVVFVAGGGSAEAVRGVGWWPASFLAVLAAAQAAALASCRARTPAEAQARAALHGAVAAGGAWALVRVVGPGRLVRWGASLHAIGVEPILGGTVALVAVNGLLAAGGAMLFPGPWVPRRRFRRGGPA
jgi:ABC-type Na+ efflux pump permease subunit